MQESKVNNSIRILLVSSHAVMCQTLSVDSLLKYVTRIKVIDVLQEAQARIATLYSPVLRLVLETLGELEAAAMGGDAPDLSPVGATNTAGSVHSSKRSASLETNSLIRESHSPSPGPPPPPSTTLTVGYNSMLYEPKIIYYQNLI